MAAASSARSPGRSVPVTRSSGPLVTATDPGDPARRRSAAGRRPPWRVPAPRTCSAGRTGAAATAPGGTAMACGTSRSPRRSQIATRSRSPATRISAATRLRSSSTVAAPKVPRAIESSRARSRRWRSESGAPPASRRPWRLAGSASAGGVGSTGTPRARRDRTGGAGTRVAAGRCRAAPSPRRRGTAGGRPSGSGGHRAG